MAYPTNYRYTREHEWISLEGKIGTVGITDYAQNSLGDIVYVDAPKVGDSVSANATFGSVESVKAVSDLYSPVSGTVTAVNEELKSAPDKINEAPHEAWIIKVELSDPSEFEKLLDAAAYEKFVSEETVGQKLHIGTAIFTEFNERQNFSGTSNGLLARG